MNQFTRREAIRRGVVPLVAVTGTGGLVAAIARAGVASAEVAFATVLAASDSSLTVARDGESELNIPIIQTRVRGIPPRTGNPFRVGERVVLDLNAEGVVVGVEPLSDFVSGVVERHDGSRLSVSGEAFVVDEWSLARVGDAQATVVPLAGIELAAGAEIGLLARRGPGRGARRIAAVFAMSGQGAEAASGADNIGVGG